MNLFLDIETYSKEDLLRYGHVKYAMHESTEILLIAWALDDSPIMSFNPSTHPTPEELLYSLNNEDIKIICHNAQFEYSLFEHTKTLYAWPDIPISRFICTSAIASTLNIPSGLGALAQYLDLPSQKYAYGKKLIQLFCKPQKDGNRIYMYDRPMEADTFINYCKRDVETMRQAYKAMPIKALTPIEQATWELDNKINEKGVPVDIKLVNACADLVKEYVDRETKRFRELYGFNPTQNKKLIEFLHSHDVKIEDTQKTTLEALVDLPLIAQKAIDIRLAVSKASVKKFNVMKNAALNGRIYGCFKYQGANTGRWSSRIVQFQNLARPTVGNPVDIESAVYKGLSFLASTYEKPLEALSSLLRHVIYSDIGLNVVDFSSIEARILAWLAGQEDILTIYRKGIDLYKHTASKMFNIPIENVNGNQRFLGKIATLALGFNGGAKAFARMAKAYKVEITEDEAEKIKLDWREANDKIVQLWRDVEQTALEVVSNKGYKTLGKLKFGMYKSYFYIRLPSGRTINYPNPIIVKSETPWGEMVDKLTYYGQATQTKQWCRMDTYGGKLVENICQATARDLQRDAMLKLDDLEYNLVLHVHDENVIENKEDYTYIITLCEIAPKWAFDLPISATGYFSNNYGK